MAEQKHYFLIVVVSSGNGQKLVHKCELEDPPSDIGFKQVLGEIEKLIPRYERIIVDPLAGVVSPIAGKLAWVVSNDDGSVQAVMSSEKNAELVQEACPGSTVVPREIDQPNCAPPPSVVANILGAIDNKLDEIADREQ